MKPTARTPMILPWLAQKAGIPLHRAAVLWDAARSYATHVTGENDTPTAWRTAIDRLYELVVAESLREDAASFGWRAWTRLNEKIWRAPLDVLDTLNLNAARSWRQLKAFQPG